MRALDTKEQRGVHGGRVGPRCPGNVVTLINVTSRHGDV